MKRCPRCKNNEFFYASAHVVQIWKVDGSGEYIKTETECDMVAHFPANDDLWTCTECGFEAEGRKFEI